MTMYKVKGKIAHEHICDCELCNEYMVNEIIYYEVEAKTKEEAIQRTEIHYLDIYYGEWELIGEWKVEELGQDVLMRRMNAPSLFDKEYIESLLDWRLDSNT